MSLSIRKDHSFNNHYGNSKNSKLLLYISRYHSKNGGMLLYSQLVLHWNHILIVKFLKELFVCNAFLFIYNESVIFIVKSVC